MRWKVARKFLEKEPSEKAIDYYCFATRDEVKSVLQNELRKISNPLENFNRFLLYKSFQQNIAKNGEHYLVGQMTGDSQAIHMPYVRVGLR